MPTTRTLLSIRLPTALLDRVARLTEPGETRTDTVERLLEHGVRQAEEAEIDALYERIPPPTPEQRERRRLMTRRAFASAHPASGHGEAV
jgi:hypothetical protein